MKNLTLTLSLICIIVAATSGQMTEPIYAAANVSDYKSKPDKSIVFDKQNDNAEKVVNRHAKSNYNVMDYLNKHITYPELAQNNFIEGKVIASVLIDAEGQIQEVSIIKGLGFGCDEEVIATLKNMPQWTPALRNGVNTSQSVTIPVHFRMQ